VTLLLCHNSTKFIETSQLTKGFSLCKCLKSKIIFVFLWSPWSMRKCHFFLFDLSGFGSCLGSLCFVMWVRATKFLNSGFLASSFRDGGGKKTYFIISNYPSSQVGKIKIHNSFYAYSMIIGFTYCSTPFKKTPGWKKKKKSIRL